MKIRIFTEPQQGATYDDLLRMAIATQELGFDGFFRSDHYLHMGDASGLPGPTDAWITLAGLARETETIRLGTLVSPATFRLPAPLAISVAQVDQMSGGRIELGLGAGWFDAEHVAYGIKFPPTQERFDVFAEQLEIIDGLWRTPVGEQYQFTGQHYQLTDSPALPKPVQQRLPIILGGAAKKRSAELAVSYADEYNASFRSLTESAQIFDRVRAAMAGSERPANSMTYSAAQVVCAGPNEQVRQARANAIGRDLAELRANGFAGSAQEIVDRAGQFSEIGTQTVYLQVLDLTDLDQLEFIAAEVAPHLASL